jgi:methane monooxygenase component A beta chain/propane monooxygenase small subunit
MNTPLSGEQHFTHLKPAGKRPTEYEELTLHIQPEPLKYHWQGWPTRFPDGRAPWVAESTALRSVDWFAFRDPSRMWQRTYVAQQAERCKSTERTVETARRRGLFAGFDPKWLSPVLDRYLQASAFLEYGLFRSLCYAQREALSDSIGNALVLDACDKIRYAQEIAIYGLELAGTVPGFNDTLGKETWLEDPTLQGSREVVERLLASHDWAEISVVVNLLLEPHLGRLLRSSFFLSFAARNGDPVTPALVETAEADADRNVAWTKDLVRLVLSDPEHAAGNRTVIGRWLFEWTPRIEKASRALAPLWDIPGGRASDFETAYAEADNGTRANLKELGLA